MAVAPKQLGHLVLRVRDLDRAEDFYTRILGLSVMQKYDGHAVFMSANAELSHELAIIAADEGAPAAEDREGRPGVAHMAWQMESWEDLQALHRLLKENDVPTRTGDHGLSLGVYFRDCDGNEIEAYYELPRSKWTAGKHLFDGKFPLSLD